MSDTRNTQGTYDLALSRADHDLWFPVVSKAPPLSVSIWDDGNSIWDGGESIWDLQGGDLKYTTFWDDGATTWDGATTGWDAIVNANIDRHAIFPIDGADKVAQQIKITLLAFMGEWFLDVTFGVPYLEEILVKNPHMPTVETILRAHINAVPHVIVINEFSMEFDRARRTLSVNFVCQTDFGAIKQSVQLDTASNV